MQPCEPRLDMMPHTAEISAAPDPLCCDKCGYDLRAQSEDGKCPECGTSIAESRRLAAIPRRPAWRDSDPRWRRRLLAGTWALVLLPLMDALQMFEGISKLPVPALFEIRGAVRTLDETFVCYSGVYQALVFCIGVVLLFSKERGRRRSRLDWTRRWGVISSYVVFLLAAANTLIITALVLAGIAALFQSMPLKCQPAVTPSFVALSTAYLRHGPIPGNASGLVLVASSSIAILLACIPLWGALRSSGPKWLAGILLAPLAVFALMYLGQIVRFAVDFSKTTSTDIFSYELYFRPRLLIRRITGFPGNWWTPAPTLDDSLAEAAKGCLVLAIAVWLTIAQLAARRHARRVRFSGRNRQ
jgi:hypothetical protein